jgi:thiol-disulfide isomerase/thioredoxin
MYRKISIFIFLIALASGIGYFLYNRFRVAPDVQFTSIKANTLDGQAYNFSLQNNKSHIILFFATWCIDCRRELPVLQKQANLLNKLNIEVLLLSDEETSTLIKFSPTIEEPFKLLKLQGSFKENHVYTLPTAFLYCKSGKLHVSKVGAIDWSPEFLNAFAANCK